MPIYSSTSASSLLAALWLWGAALEAEALWAALWPTGALSPVEDGAALHAASERASAAARAAA